MWKNYEEKYFERQGGWKLFISIFILFSLKCLRNSHRSTCPPRGWSVIIGSIREPPWNAWRERKDRYKLYRTTTQEEKFSKVFRQYWDDSTNWSFGLSSRWPRRVKWKAGACLRFRISRCKRLRHDTISYCGLLRWTIRWWTQNQVVCLCFHSSRRRAPAHWLHTSMCHPTQEWVEKALSLRMP